MRYKTLTTLLIALTLLSLVVYLPHEVGAQAWLPGWMYRRAVTISNSLNQPLTDYQVRVTLNTQTLISQGKVRSDCGDIRFTDSDGATLLPYWIEPGTCNTSSTTIFVKVPSIPASSTKTIYVYYGNPNATSAEDPGSVFLLFDDFSGTSLNTSKWTWFHVGGHNDCYKSVVSVSNGVLTIEAQSDDYSSPFCFIAVQSLIKFNYAVIITVNLSAPNWGGLGSAGYFRSVEYGFIPDTSTTEANTYVFAAYNEWGRYLEVSTETSRTRSNDYTALDPRVFHKASIVLIPGSKAMWYVNDSLAATLTANVPPSTYSLPVEFKARHWGPTSYPSGKLIVDYVFVRKYAEPEPTATVSSTEEELPSVSAVYTGTPVTLESVMNIAAGDALAPHLYDWYFDGVDDYVETVAFDIGSQDFAYVLGVRKIHKYYTLGWEWLLRKNLDVWHGEFSVTLEGVGCSTFRVHLSDGSMFGIYTLDWAPYMFDDLAWHDIAFTYGANASVYVDGQLKRTATVTVQRATANSALRIGGHGDGHHYPFYVSHVILYSRALADADVLSVSQRVISANGLALFLDATFYNGTHYIDLSGGGKHAMGYYSVSRIPAESPWIYLVKALHNDGSVHLRFFPPGSVVEFYDSSTNALVLRAVIDGSPNQAGLIEDYPVSLPNGSYRVKVYTYINPSVNQNHGSTRYAFTPRYAPGSNMRVMFSTVGNLSAIHVQLSSDPGFSNLLVNTTVSDRYLDVQLPPTNGTYYVRARARYGDYVWSDWSPVLSFRADYPVVSVSAPKARLDLSSSAAVTYSVAYTDGSQVPAFTGNYTATLVQTGTRPVYEAWWSVDVYSGASSSAEPPGTGYTYKGTVCPTSAHSYFASAYLYGSMPSGYGTGYVYMGLGDEQAPYWALAVGAQNTSFALVYQALVYLPLSGTYTIEVHTDKGTRVYINGSLVIDGWSGGESRSASVALSAGWYNFTVKYWQSTGSSRFILGLVLPNGTAVRPLRPAYGIQMMPLNQSCQVIYPSPGVKLVAVDPPLTNASGSLPINFSLGSPGVVNVTVTFKDFATNQVVSRNATLMWDAVYIDSFTPSKPRFTVGDPPSFNITAVYALDGLPFQGSFTLNDTSTKTGVGLYWYRIVGVSDQLYGLTKFAGSTATSVIFDKLVLDSYTFTALGKQLANNTRVDYTLPVSISVILKHAYDDLPLDPNARVELAGNVATWNGSAWTATVQPPGITTAVSYQVVSYAESTLGVRYTGTLLFRIIHDSINVTYHAHDPVQNTVTLKAVYGYDSALVPSGTACINDSGTLVCAPIVNGYSTLGFNRFTNGTVSFANATDGYLVFTNPTKPGTLLAKYASWDKKISLTATNTAEYINHTELPGFIKVVAKLKGDASIYVNTTLTPVLVKVNGAPRNYSVVNNIVVLSNLSSTVEAYYSTPAAATTIPGAAPAGVVYEVGFANSPALESASLKLAVLVNGSRVDPVLYYNGSAHYGTGVAGLAYPLGVAVSWECEASTLEVSYMVAYALGNSTHFAVSRYAFAGAAATCPERLYPYLAVSGNATGVVDKYGAVLSEALRYIASGVMRLVVQGPVSAGGMVKYLVLSSPTRVVYERGGISVEPGGSAPVTLVGFKGFTLSYSVAGVTVSNVIVASDEFPLSFPYGIAVVAVADPASRTVSLVQVAAPMQPVVVPPPTRTPAIYVPQPPSPAPAVFPGDWGAPQFIVLYGAAVAVAVAASRITGSVPRGIMLASLAFGIALFGIGVYTGDMGALGTALLAFVVAAAAEVARRHAV